MNLQRDETIIRQTPERYTEEEDNQWTLESPMKTSKMGSLSASIATSTDIQQKNTEQKERSKKHEPVSNATRRGTLPKTVEENRR